VCGRTVLENRTFAVCPRGSGTPLSPFTTVAAMFAFSPDRQAVQHTHPTSDGARRFVRTGVGQPGVQPGSQPLPAPTVPFTAPSEPVHERAYPQADGEP
jgi:hypothetical protein